MRVDAFVAIFLILLTMKLAEIGQVAELSWWIVTAPLWGPIALAIAIVLICIPGMLLYRYLDNIGEI